MGLSPYTIENIFELLNNKDKIIYNLLDNKAFYENQIIKKDILDNIFDTLEFSKAYYTDHPWGSLIISKKK